MQRSVDFQKRLLSVFSLSILAGVAVMEPQGGLTANKAFRVIDEGAYRRMIPGRRV